MYRVTVKVEAVSFSSLFIFCNYLLYDHKLNAHMAIFVTVFEDIIIIGEKKDNLKKLRM